MKRNRRWLNEHFSDKYVKEAQKAGYRSRSAFKLLDIQKKDRIISPGMTVVDLGATPGGWSQAAVKLSKGRGRVLAVDILPMDTIARVDFIQGDFREQSTLNDIIAQLDGQSVDLVMSDMAPNISGIQSRDQAAMMTLAEMALKFSEQVLKPNGIFLIKLFQGSEFQEYVKQLRDHFQQVVIRKPKSSRNRSSEVYLLAKGFKKIAFKQ
jgi:23S rRNA (uridine2552-2'-O)-methyltransferase